MAEIRWRAGGTGFVLVVLLAFLGCVSFSHGRSIRPADRDLSSPSTTEVREYQLEAVELGDSDLDEISVSAYTARMRGDVKISAAITGEISRELDDTDSNRKSENRFVSDTQGQKWKVTLGTAAEWIFHACIVVLAVYAILYTISCVCACCIGLDLLAEIWRILGGWQAFNYFVHVEQAVVETGPQSSPLLRPASQP